MRKSEKTRKAIIQAGHELFSVRDVSLVSVEAITKKAGVGKGTFYLYFDSKADLVEALIRDAVEHPTEKLDHFANVPPKISFVDKIVDDICLEINEHRKVLELMHKVQFLRFLAKNFSGHGYNDRWRKSLRKWIARGVEEGTFSNLDPDFVSEFIVLGAHGLLDNLISSGSLSREDSLDLFSSQLKIIIKNILKP